MTDEQRTQFFAEIDERLQRARALNRAIRDAVAAEQSVEDAEEGGVGGGGGGGGGFGGGGQRQRQRNRFGRFGGTQAPLNLRKLPDEPEEALAEVAAAGVSVARLVRLIDGFKDDGAVVEAASAALARRGATQAGGTHLGYARAPKTLLLVLESPAVRRNPAVVATIVRLLTGFAESSRAGQTAVMSSRRPYIVKVLEDLARRPRILGDADATVAILSCFSALLYKHVKFYGYFFICGRR